MGTNSKHSSSNERFFANGSPSNKKQHPSGSHQQHRPSPSKSINIKTPNNKNQSSNVAGYVTNNNNNSHHGNKRISGSCSPPMLSYFAASKCFESPSPQSLPKPPTSWFDDCGKKSESFKASGKPQRARKSLNLATDNSGTSSCAVEYAKQQSFAMINDHYTQNLKLLLNVSA